MPEPKQEEKLVFFKNKMCKLSENQENDDAITCAPGMTISLRWKIVNESNQVWPRFPILCNINQNYNVVTHLTPAKYMPDFEVKTKL